MNAIMRKGVRGAAAGLGALAIVVGASACGAIGDLTGGGDGGDDPAVEEPAEDEGAEDEGAAAEEGDAAEDAGGESSDGGDSGALSEEDLTAAADQFFAFLQAAGGGDGETACALILDPTTGEPMAGDVLDGCVSRFSSEEEGLGLDPSTVDSLDRSMIEATDKGDGTAGIGMMGTDLGFTMVKADDGKWYVDSQSTP